MRSLVGSILNRAPVSYAPPTNRLSIPFLHKNDAVQQMEAYGKVGTLFAIVNRTASAVSQVEWKLWRKARSGKKEDRTEVTSHAALDVWNKPNPFMTGQEFVETFSQHIDLTGEGWWLVGRDKRSSLPLELWPVRPDRMEPVPSAKDFLSGYVYCGPDGEKVDLGLDDVIFLRMPNPLDPYRGLGPVQAILTVIDSSRYSAEWNRNFFLNSAEPGGIIEVPERLDDDEWDEMTTRWEEQHRGVANAHRVAVIEHGKWVDRSYSMRDMQFVELARLSKEDMREAFAMSKTMLGVAESETNRATAEAAEYVFAKYNQVPRLERIKGALNNDFLGLWGATDVEFDYENPVPEDSEQENAGRDSRVSAAVALIELGADPTETFESYGLPVVTINRPPSPVKPDPPGPIGAHVHRRPRNAVELPDVSYLQDSWQKALDGLMGDWEPLEAIQKAALVSSVGAIAATGALSDLADLSVPSTDQAKRLLTAMLDMANEAAEQVVGEADAQGVQTAAGKVDERLMGEVATVVAAARAAALAQSAALAAVRANGPDVTADEVAEATRDHLGSLTLAGAILVLGGALTGAQNAGRIATFRVAPVARLYASEVNDHNTCEPCAAINGQMLGTTADMDEALDAYPGGSYGGYVDCEGRERCRGTLVGVW